MPRRCLWLIAMLVPPLLGQGQGVGHAQGRDLAHAPAVPLQLSYETYAAGLDIAQVEAGLGLGRSTYEMNLTYRTTGMVGFFYHGQQFATVRGAWDGTRPRPQRFFARGVWRGNERVTDIAYHSGMPIVRRLVPSDEARREVVPDPLRDHTVDTLSAMAELVRTVQATGRCETAVRTFDGRRATDIQAVTVGEAQLAPSGRSMFAGRALRCDFTGRMVSGFLRGHSHERDGRPIHGSAWLAPVVAGGPPVPVRVTVETRWLGDVTTYLTAAGAQAHNAGATPARGAGAAAADMAATATGADATAEAEP